jgi:hypothetical protein
MIPGKGDAMVVVVDNEEVEEVVQKAEVERKQDTLAGSVLTL